MRVLFSMLTTSYLRNYESVLRGLARRGHRVDVLIHEPTGAESWDALADSLAREHPSLSFHHVSSEAPDAWARLALEVRSCLDYLQFLNPRYRRPYQSRADARVPGPMRRLSQLPLVRTSFGRSILELGLRLVDRAIPASPAIEQSIAALEPDVVLFTPLIGLRTIQPDYLKGARALGLKTGFCVASWDNLTSKSTLRLMPDQVFVWNEVQKDEAIRLHRVPPDRIVVTGAQLFDEWFERKPSPREEFCQRVGLDPGRPYLLWACTSTFKGSRPEWEFVVEWLERLRGSAEPLLREVSVLVRPHPKRMAEWKDADLSRLGPAVVWPKPDAAPSVEETKADYYDSMFHSAAVAGLNTSVFLEAAIVGRPVHTILSSTFAGSQAGTFHFHYLTSGERGLLRVGRDFDEHFRQLAESVEGGGQPAESRRFIEAFVRPQGLDKASTPIFVGRVEALAAGGPLQRPWRVSPLLRPLRLSLHAALSAFLFVKHPPQGPFDRVSLLFRDGTDLARRTYIAARRMLAFPTLLRRRRVARSVAAKATFEIPRSAGFRIFEPGYFPEAGEIVAEAQAAAKKADPRALKSTKPFMIGLLRDGQLGPDSPFLRFALRPDVLASVAAYLGVVPVLTHVDVYYSAWASEAESSSQLFHCDCDDLTQVKVFVLCSEVRAENGPMTIMGARTSEKLRRRLRYRYRNRVSDADALAAVGEGDRHPVAGAPGTVCFVDTSRCFHYGSRVRQGAAPRLVAMMQFLTPFSFMVSRDRHRATPFVGAIGPESTPLERLALGAAS